MEENPNSEEVELVIRVYAKPGKTECKNCPLWQRIKPDSNYWACKMPSLSNAIDCDKYDILSATFVSGLL